MIPFRTTAFSLGYFPKRLSSGTVDTIPDDSRFGKYPSEKAEAILVAAFYSREERMRNRLRRNSTSLS